MPVEKELWLAVGLIALAFLFILPPWSDIGSNLSIKEARLSNNRVFFTIDYSAPWAKSCYLVVYGPFEIDSQGHEKGNNIYVLSKRQGELSDSLRLQENRSLEKLKVELWCDWKKLNQTSTVIS